MLRTHNVTNSVLAYGALNTFDSRRQCDIYLGKYLPRHSDDKAVDQGKVGHLLSQ